MDRELVFRAVFEEPDATGAVWYTFLGQRRGPFPSPRHARSDLLHTVLMWGAEVRGVGGGLLLRSPTEVVVTLPTGTVGIDTLTRWGRRPHGTV